MRKLLFRTEVSKTDTGYASMCVTPNGRGQFMAPTYEEASKMASYFGFLYCQGADANEAYLTSLSGENQARIVAMIDRIKDATHGRLVE